MTSLFDLIARLWRGEATTVPEPEAVSEPKRRAVETEMVVVGDLDRDERGAHREPGGSGGASPGAATVAAVAGGAFVLGAAVATHHARADSPSDTAPEPAGAGAAGTPDGETPPPSDDPGPADHAEPSSDAAPADLAHHDGDAGGDHADAGGDGHADFGDGSGGDTFG